MNKFLVVYGDKCLLVASPDERGAVEYAYKRWFGANAAGPKTFQVVAVKKEKEVTVRGVSAFKVTISKGGK